MCSCLHRHMQVVPKFKKRPFRRNIRPCTRPFNTIARNTIDLHEVGALDGTTMQSSRRQGHDIALNFSYTLVGAFDTTASTTCRGRPRVISNKKMVLKLARENNKLANKHLDLGHKTENIQIKMWAQGSFQQKNEVLRREKTTVSACAHLYRQCGCIFW